MRHYQQLTLSLILVLAATTSSANSAEHAIQPVVINMQNCSSEAPEKKDNNSKTDKGKAEQSAQPQKTIVYCPAEKAKDAHGGKYVVGEVEWVTLDPPGVVYKARIDTGATTSSLNAFDITPFERDGVRWVKFKLTDPETNETVEMSRKVARRIRVKQHGTDGHRRYTVKMRVRLGTIDQRIEFSLADRSEYDFPVLIGRNLLKDIAVVDVSKKLSKKPVITENVSDNRNENQTAASQPSSTNESAKQADSKENPKPTKAAPTSTPDDDTKDKSQTTPKPSAKPTPSNKPTKEPKKNSTPDQTANGKP
ncbi:ATP-dependent zinc protease family protein [Zooshikella harenae]|uniref:ATP-dependent zinc protease n=1 Tax=Zooshikella harenae TaxID=2827238 RepID=A0ABS5ZIN8_9GAMM|nr:ATP-dependent zinc protease [Zooshikella harenae]MBU2713115.1 ATP-dependent zinc protease [Zooshikella harenae]